jgi:hypothetical protein
MPDSVGRNWGLLVLLILQHGKKGGSVMRDFPLPLRLRLEFRAGMTFRALGRVTSEQPVIQEESGIGFTARPVEASQTRFAAFVSS